MYRLSDIYPQNGTFGNPLLAFIHVPKTGGTSLQAILEGVLMNSRPVFNIRHPLQAKKFLSLPEHEQSNYYGVFGHMPAGICRHVNRPVIYMTFLRDPVERILSAYAHNLRHPEEPGADVACAEGISWTGHLSNIAVSCLANHDLLQEPDESGAYWATEWPMTDAQLEQAKRNLERCAFVGLHEHYEHDVRLLPELVGHRILVPSNLPREKVGHNRVRRDELSPEQIEAIRAGNRLDIALYEHALRLRDRWGGPLNPAYRRRENWQTLAAKWWAHQTPESSEHDVRLPARFRTPPEAWHYGAVSEILPLKQPTTLRIVAELNAGAVGFCLLDQQASAVISEQRSLSQGAGRETLFLTFSGGQPARLCLLNFDGSGHRGEATVYKVDYVVGP